MKTHLSMIVAACLLLSAPAAQAQQNATGWLPHNDYQYFYDEAFYGNLAPVHVEAAVFYGQVHFSAVFGYMPAGFSTWATHHGMSDAAFALRNQDYLNRGYRLIQHQRLNQAGHLDNQGIWYR